MDAKVETNVAPKEEEELGKFFEKLADLVPKLQCPCDLSQSDCCVTHSNETNNRINNQSSDKFRNIKSECESNFPNSYECSFSRTVNTAECPNKSSTTNLMFIESSDYYCSDGQNSTISVHNNTLSNTLSSNHHLCSKRNQPYHSKLTRSSHVVKPCKVRNRPAPYKLTKHDHSNKYSHHTSEVNHHNARSTSSRFYHHTTKNSFSTNPEPETEERLELLTDVIEYIHNLKSILENAQNRTYTSDIELGGSTRFCLENREIQRRPGQVETTQYRAEDASEVSPKRGTSDGLQPVDHAIKLIDCSVPSTGSSTYRIVDPVPVDRAMELLEYKTGAITLTA